MAAEQEAQVSEAQIAVHWREEDYYQPVEAVAETRLMSSRSVLRESRMTGT